MIDPDHQRVSRVEATGNAPRPLWNARTVWQPGGSQQAWPSVALNEFLSWHTDHPEGPNDEDDGSLPAQLPKLNRFAREIQRELTHGTGVALLSAPGDGWDESALRQLYWVSGILMGKPITSYGKMYEVKDQGTDHRRQRIPVSQTSASTSLHTDSSSALVQPDLVGLLCIQPAREGGDSRITSALTAHRLLEQTCPELLKLLYGDFFRDVVTPGTEPTLQCRLENCFPIYHNDPDRGLNFRYMRYWIETGQQGVSRPLSPAQIEALDALERALEAPGAVATFSMQQGEMLWLDNRTVAHDRTAYVDDPLRPRRLVRLWLDLPPGQQQG